MAENIGAGIMYTGAIVFTVLCACAEASNDSVVGVTYTDAIKAIVNSEMDSYWQNSIIEAMVKDENSDYYEQVVAIVNSDLDDYYKCKMIKKMSESE